MTNVMVQRELQSAKQPVQSHGGAVSREQQRMQACHIELHLSDRMKNRRGSCWTMTGSTRETILTVRPT